MSTRPAADPKAEHQILVDAHRWGLHSGERGRLPILEQLATLQHFGAPTRLVDVTLNAYIGLWFAVEQKFEQGVEVKADVDGRLFAIEISKRLINETDGRRGWEDALERPWKHESERDWCGSTWVWRPALFQSRIASQHSAFLLGGVPKAGLGVAWPKTPKANSATWGEDEVRQCMSLPFRINKPPGSTGRPPNRPAYTFRIKAAAKPEIRERLHQLFGYRHQTLFADYPGFAAHATPYLRDRARDPRRDQRTESTPG